MGSIKSIVKVMNFHSLLRVDKSRTQAKKFIEMEGALNDIIENLMYNRNIMLDYKSIQPDPDLPPLYLYIGSDLGFCANVNNLVKKEMSKDEKEAEQKAGKVVIGRKLFSVAGEDALLIQTREDFDKDRSKVYKIVEDAIRNLEYSSVNLVYNQYVNASQVDFAVKQVFPVEDKEDHPVYREDFALEGDPEELLLNMLVLHAKYNLEIAAATSFAAENINRQNVTTQSLDKIAEREEVQKMEVRKEEKEKQFAKVLDNFTHRRK